VAVETVGAELARNDLPERVTFVCFDEPTIEIYRHALDPADG
jgi:hypothetical protein